MLLQQHFNPVKKHWKKLFILPSLYAAFLIGYTTWQVSAHGGDLSLIHSCISPAGLIRIVDATDTCKTGETALDWSQYGQETTRYASTGTTIDPFNPAATWLDVPGAAITQDFGGGTWKASYAGVLKMSGGNGTAYVRLEVRPTGGTNFTVGQQTYYRFQSTLPSSESSTEQFFTQTLINMPAGEVTIVPQVYGPSNWSLMGGASLIMEK